MVLFPELPPEGSRAPIFQHVLQAEGSSGEGLGCPNHKYQQMGLLAGGIPVTFRHPPEASEESGGGKQVSAGRASALDSQLFWVTV